MGRICLAAALLFPAKTDGASGDVDLRAHYWSIRRPFFLVLVPLMSIYTATTGTMSHDLFTSIDVYRVTFFVMYLVLATTKRRKVHELIAGAQIAVLALFLATEVIGRSLVG
jgi:hypothetical protein